MINHRVIGPASFAFVLATALACPLAQASDSANSPIRECVGRSEFALPGNAEAALYPLEVVARLAKPPALLVEATFDDGQIAGYTGWQYRGDLYVTRPIASAQVADLLHKFSELRQNSRAYAARKNLNDMGMPQPFEALSANAQSLAWRLGSSYRGIWNLSGVILHWSSTYGPGTDAPNAQAYQWILGAVPRASFEIPAGPGVCLPSLFIPDDGKVERSIASTYRLKQHPDVTVWVQDSGSEEPSPTAKLGHPQQSIKDNDFFWAQNYQDRIGVRSLWSLPHPIEMRGVLGTASFVELMRKDGTIDYGYFASSWGSPDSAVGATQIKMFVIRDAKVAKAKGITPVDREALLDMAESVLHSIKARGNAHP